RNRFFSRSWLTAAIRARAASDGFAHARAVERMRKFVMLFTQRCWQGRSDLVEKVARRRSLCLPFIRVDCERRAQPIVRDFESFEIEIFGRWHQSHRRLMRPRRAVDAI